MARPIKLNVDYFPHDSNASDGRTMTILFNNFGHEGVSAWWQLLERISRTNNHVIAFRNAEDMEFLAAKLRFKPERLREILDKMAELAAIDEALYRDGMLWSQNLVDRLSAVYKNRGQAVPVKPPVSAGKNAVSAGDNFVALPDNATEKGIRESKGIKETALFDLFWREYPKKVGRGEAEKAFKKLKPSQELVDRIIEAIRKQKQSDQWNKDGGQFIPNPSTWLNQKRWEDELSAGGRYGNSRIGKSSVRIPEKYKSVEQILVERGIEREPEHSP
jgi:hypothetical protein